MCCTRCMSSWPCSGVCLWVRMSKISRTRYSISQMGCMIVEKVRFRSLVGTCEGAFRLNQQFEIHTSQKSWNLLHILVELPWTIYLPLFLLLKIVMVKYTGVPCGISKCNLKHSTRILWICSKLGDTPQQKCPGSDQACHGISGLMGVLTPILGGS